MFRIFGRFVSVAEPSELWRVFFFSVIFAAARWKLLCLARRLFLFFSRLSRHLKVRNSCCRWRRERVRLLRLASCFDARAAFPIGSFSICAICAPMGVSA